MYGAEKIKETVQDAIGQLHLRRSPLMAKSYWWRLSVAKNALMGIPTTLFFVMFIAGEACADLIQC
jgi:hypothetical protein